MGAPTAPPSAWRALATTGCRASYSTIAITLRGSIAIILEDMPSSLPQSQVCLNLKQLASISSLRLRPRQTLLLLVVFVTATAALPEPAAAGGLSATVTCQPTWESLATRPTPGWWVEQKFSLVSCVMIPAGLRADSSPSARPAIDLLSRGLQGYHGTVLLG